jgi:hypothetical protein
MLIDFDEYVIPGHNRTIPEMLAYVDQQKASGAIPVSGGGSGPKSVARVPHRGAESSRPRTVSSYSFQNAFFYLQFGDDQDFDPGDPRLRVLLKTRRKSKFNPQKQRSKYICVPRNVKEAGNHFIWEFSEGFNLNVPTSVGFLHHYRVCEFGGGDCIHTDSKVDRTAYKYRDDLVANTRKVLEDNKECKFNEPSESESGSTSESSSSSTTKSLSKKGKKKS